MTINKVLGNILELSELPNVRIIPDFHPALLLHSPGNYKVFQSVLETVVQFYKGGTVDPGVTQWSWVSGQEDLEELISIVNQLPYVSADIETSSLYTKKAQIWTFGIALTKNITRVIDHETICKYPELIKKLFRAGCKWIWHHGKYDTEVWWWKNFKDAWLDEDVIYLHYCLNETNGTHGLGKLATVYLGADEYKSKMNAEFNNITNYEAYLHYKEDLGERVAIDADYTLQCYEIFKPQIEANPDWKKLYDVILIPGANFLRKVQMRGMKVDVPYLEGRKPIYEQKIEEITAEVQEAASPFWNLDAYKSQTGAKSGSVLFKPTSVKQLAWLIYDKLKLKPHHKDAKKRGTGEEVLESIDNPPEFIIRILELRKVKKEYSTYVLAYLEGKDENDLVHTSFNLHITATGRLSSTDPNLQNVPSKRPDIRNAFIPRAKDRILMEVDYSGAELRVLAYISGDKNLTRALTEGDPHGELAEKIFGDRYINGTAEERKELRGRAKTVNFGVAYGRQADSIATDFHITKAEAQTYIDAWAEMYPDAWIYLQSCADDAISGKPLTTLYGRYRRFGLIHQANIQDLINEAKNYRIQSISSDNTFLAAMEADEELESKYDALIVNLIHDSILIDCPADPTIVKAVSELMVNTMITLPMRRYGCTVPFKSDVDMGPRWGTFGAYDKDTSMVEYHKEEFPYVEWIKTYGVAI
jgi:DNA polymerase-1